MYPGLSGGTIEYMISTRLTGGYRVAKSGNWTGWGTSNIDGPALVKTGAKSWTICVEDSNYASQLRCGTSKDNFVTVSRLAPISAPIQAQHGTIIPITSTR